ncbi:MAG: hypothetical protein NT009_04980 [Proteobacteria bacterium]|nr:hypothetical protein [Pseudomonadota bacterium]
MGTSSTGIRRARTAIFVCPLAIRLISILAPSHKSTPWDTDPGSHFDAQGAFIVKAPCLLKASGREKCGEMALSERSESKSQDI